MDCAAACRNGWRRRGSQRPTGPNLDHASSPPAVLALPPIANTVALIEMLIPTAPRRERAPNDSSP